MMWSDIVQGLPRLLVGLVVTFELTLLSLAAGTVIGLIGGLAIVYGSVWLRALFRGYCDITRGIPVLVIIFAVFYGLPIMGNQISATGATIIALGAFVGAHVVEIVRGGINSIPKGQTDAAKAIGLTFWQRMIYVILPQAVRRMLPPWVNAAVEMVKATSLVSLIGVPDLLLQTQQLTARTMIVLPFYFWAALLYFMVNYSLSLFARFLERRYAETR
jgi:polar amino acid transport system permease protein